MAIKIYGKLDSQALNDKGKPVLGEAKQIELDPSNNIPASNTTVQEAIEDLYKNGGGSSNVKLQSLPSGAQFMSMLDMAQWPRTLLASISNSYTGNEGEMFVMYGGFSADDTPAVIVYKENNVVYTLGEPSEYVIYTAKDNKRSYYWNGTKFIEVPAMTIFNENDKKNYRIWVGTQQQYNDLYNKYEDDIIYFIGSNTGGSEPDEKTYNVYENKIVNCALVSDTPTPIVEGGEYRGRIILNEGCALSDTKITMGKEDITNASGVLEVDPNNSLIYNIHIQEVTSDIYIDAVATVLLKRIDILVTSNENSNLIDLVASLTPKNTSQNVVNWKLVGNATGTAVASYTNVELIPNSTDSLKAQLRIIDPEADGDIVYVQCTSSYNSDISIIREVSITYNDGGGDEPVTPPSDDNTPIDFKDTRVKDILLSNGYGSNGEITKSQAEELVARTGNIFLNNTEIEYFDEYENFTKSTFTFKGCTNLKSVKFPVVEKSTGKITEFGQQFGIVNTGLTAIDIPEGYTIYSNNVTIGGTTYSNGGITQGANITSITFPKSLQQIITIGGQPASGEPYLPNISKIDLWDTQITSLPYRVFNKLRSSDYSTGLTEVRLPSQLTVLDYAGIFYGCHKVNKLEFGPLFEGSASDGAIFTNEDANSVNSSSLELIFHGDVPGTKEGRYFKLGDSRFNLSNNRNKVTKIYVYDDYYENYTTQSEGFFHDYVQMGGTFENMGTAPSIKELQ